MEEPLASLNLNSTHEIHQKDQLIDCLKKEIIALRAGGYQAREMNLRKSDLCLELNFQLIDSLTRKNKKLLQLLLDSERRDAIGILSEYLTYAYEVHSNTEDLDKEIESLLSQLSNQCEPSFQYQLQSAQKIWSSWAEKPMDLEMLGYSPISRSSSLNKYIYQSFELQKQLIQAQAKLTMAQQKIFQSQDSVQVKLLKKSLQERNNQLKKCLKEIKSHRKQEEKQRRVIKKLSLKVDVNESHKKMIAKMNLIVKEKQQEINRLKQVLQKNEQKIQSKDKQMYAQKLHWIKLLTDASSSQVMVDIKTQFFSLQTALKQTAEELQDKLKLIHSLKATLNEKELMIQEINQLKESQEKLLEDSFKENQRLKDLIQQYQNEISILQSNSAQQKLEKLYEQHQELKEKYNQLMHDTNQLDNLNSMIHELQNELEQDQKYSSNLLQVDYKWNRKEIYTKAEYQALQQKLSQEKKRSTLLQTEISINEKLHRKIQELNNINIELNNFQRKNEQDIQQRDSTINCLVQTVKQLEQKLSSYKQDLDVLIQQNQDTIMKMQEMTVEKEEYSQQKVVLNRLNSLLQIQVEEILESQNRTLQDQQQKFANRTLFLENQLKLSEIKIQNLELELKETKNLQQSVEKYQKIEKFLLQKVKSLQKRLEEFLQESSDQKPLKVLNEQTPKFNRKKYPNDTPMVIKQSNVDKILTSATPPKRSYQPQLQEKQIPKRKKNLNSKSKAERDMKRKLLKSGQAENTEKKLKSRRSISDNFN